MFDNYNCFYRYGRIWLGFFGSYQCNRVIGGVGGGGFIVWVVF